MVTIQIKADVIEWLMDRLDYHYDDALSFAQEFAGMLYFSGAFVEPTTPAKEDFDPYEGTREPGLDYDGMPPEDADYGTKTN